MEKDMINSIIRNTLLSDNLELFKKQFIDYEEDIYNYTFADNNVFSYAILQKATKIINFLSANFDYTRMGKSNPLITAAFMNNYSLVKKITPRIDKNLLNEYSLKTGKNTLSTYLIYNIDKEKNYKKTNALLFFSKQGYRFDLPMISKNFPENAISNESPAIFEIIRNNPEILKEPIFFNQLLSNGLSPDITYNDLPLLFSMLYNAKNKIEIPLEIYLAFFAKSEILKTDSHFNACSKLIIQNQKNGKTIIENIENYLLKKEINIKNTIVQGKKRL